MELTPNADESAIINDTIEQLDTWNQPRNNLGEFVMSKVAAFDRRTAGVTFDDDDLFDLAA
jgi:hypothetical protein